VFFGNVIIKRSIYSVFRVSLNFHNASWRLFIANLPIGPNPLVVLLSTNNRQDALWKFKLTLKTEYILRLMMTLPKNTEILLTRLSLIKKTIDVNISVK
jgi:hypothetical protein